MNEFDSPSPPNSKNVRLWTMAIHLSQFGNFLVPLAGFVAPIVIWQIQKDSMPEVEAHGRNVINWQITFIIYLIISALLCFALIGIPLLMIVGALGVVYPIIGAIKAGEGVAWKYPGTIKFI